jgi:Holliday junction resolvase
MTNKKSNTEIGNSFEIYVENIYQGLGFKTVRDKRVNGQQTDIIAEKEIEGVGVTRIIIECKFLEKTKVSNQIVYDFISFLKSVGENSKFVKGVIVTNTGFSEDSKSIDSSLISLITVQELEKQLFDFNKYYLSQIKLYEKEAIYYEYITLMAKDITSNSVINIIGLTQNLGFSFSFVL